MMYNLITTLEYCGSYVGEAFDLLLYSHIPAVATVLFVAIFIYSKNSKLLPSKILLALSIAFSAWVALNITIWLGYKNADLLMFAWSLIEVFGALLFALSFYFVYVFIEQKDLSLWKKIFVFTPLIPLIVLAPTNLYLVLYDMQECVATENYLYNRYLIWVKIIFALLTLSYLLWSFIKKTDIRKQIAILSVGIIAFLYSFLVAGYIAERTLDYRYEFYGLFAVVAFVGALAYLIVRYAAFDIKVIATQALIITLVLLVGSRMFFSTTFSGFMISAITFAFVSLFAYFLIRSVNKEVELRTETQKLAKNLEFANIRQLETMRFITHEVKGYLTDASAGFDAIATESFGPVAEDLKEMSKEALARVQYGVNEVKNFLHVSDFKTGKVEYSKEKISLKELLVKSAEELKKRAADKKLTLTLNVPDEECVILGDADYILNHVLKNLVDNAINYTPAGSVTVSLARKGDKILFSVQDSGVGLTDEDKAVLFTEGGRGKDSRTVNVHSTGYGLFIAKKIVDAHNGRIWAQSEGRGKGSTFSVEFPAV